jgi:ferric-dicitrate binding protein FerR (iron transport regulator)
MMEATEVQDAAMVRAFAGGREAAAALTRRVELQLSGAASTHRAAAGHSAWHRSAMRIAGWTAAAAAGFIAALLFMRPAAAPVTPLQLSAQTAEPIAHLALTSGEVFTCPSGDKAWQPIVQGASLEPGAKVRTSRAAKCELALPGGSRLRLNSGTELRLATASDVQLTGGQIWSALPQDAGMLRVAAGDACVTTGGPLAQFDVACEPNAATVTVVAGSAQVNGKGQAATVRGGESLRVGAVAPVATYSCEPVTDPMKATQWLDDLLVLLPPDDPELQARVDALLTRIVAERNRPAAAASEPGPIEHDVRASGPLWAAPMARYATKHLSPPAEADQLKRLAAARLLADLAPPSCIGDVIPLLADDDGEVRFHAAAALNRLTGQTLGFSPRRCAATPRDPAPLAAWQEWWMQNRSRYVSGS